MVRPPGRCDRTALGTARYLWAISGPLFGFSDTWQLVINTGTTIVTFLMVFLIQATQNRDTPAMQLKVDELILATRNARNEIAGIEEQTDAEIAKAKEKVLQGAGYPSLKLNISSRTRRETLRRP